MARKNWHELDARDRWRAHFSINAADLLQVQRVFAGEEVFTRLLRACLKRGKAERINEATVQAVLAADHEAHS